ncbi:AMP-binding protein [Amycolatopsis lexingtonensis]|uniref:AMP-binding protein n=1 Tax=Amycolatopsis lexingtonensis TaxID=218822 RepID=UPI003F7257A0
MRHALHRLGLEPGDGVVAIVHNGLPYFGLLFAALQAGRYFTPVSHRSSPAEIAYVVANSGARVVVAARAATASRARSGSARPTPPSTTSAPRRRPRRTGRASSSPSATSGTATAKAAPSCSTAAPT